MCSAWFNWYIFGFCTFFSTKVVAFIFFSSVKLYVVVLFLNRRYQDPMVKGKGDDIEKDVCTSYNGRRQRIFKECCCVGQETCLDCTQGDRMMSNYTSDLALLQVEASGFDGQ